MTPLVLVSTDAHLALPKRVVLPDGGLQLEPLLEQMAGADRLWLAIVDDTAVGIAGLIGDDPDWPEVSFGIAPRYRGRRFSSQIVQALCGFARALAVRGLTARTLETNPTSAAALLGGGFTHVRTADEPGVGLVQHWSWTLR